LPLIPFGSFASTSLGLFLERLASLRFHGQQLVKLLVGGARR